MVNGTIRDLQMEIGDFCSEANAISVAKSLQVENVVVGNIIRLPDKQIRIICEVLHVPSREYRGDISLTGTNIQQLRKSLKKEIRKIFSS